MPVMPPMIDPAPNGSPVKAEAIEKGSFSPPLNNDYFSGLITSILRTHNTPETRPPRPCLLGLPCIARFESQCVSRNKRVEEFVDNMRMSG